jgi:predicted ATPase
MKITELRMVGVRCFEDTGNLHLHPQCNIIVGKNNSGKSTLLKGILHWQLTSLHADDARPEFIQNCHISALMEDVPFDKTPYHQRNSEQRSFKAVAPLTQHPSTIGINYDVAVQGNPLFYQARPLHTIVPFLAKRKSIVFSQQVNSNEQDRITGTFDNLYSRIDMLATSGHPDHDRFKALTYEIVGLDITTKASSGGKEAGFYLSREKFVTFDRMGDGVPEMVALIVECCLEEGKIFVLEEPEANLHPQGLKALVKLIRESSKKNQFFIATHSNIVVRELGDPSDGKLFRVFRDGESHDSPSKVEEVQPSPQARIEVLRDLGYEFADYSLFDAWLFLEESSAEAIINQVLIPYFVSALRGRLRTYSSGGVIGLEPSVSEFKRLIVFVHLQEVYAGRIWVRADGDPAGAEVVAKMRASFSGFDDDAIATFNKEQFEHYYPTQFQEKAKVVLGIADKNEKRKQKASLLQEVLSWSRANRDEARLEWEKSAAEPIAFLKSILAKLGS